MSTAGMIEQGTEEWHKLRCGRLTASRFKPVMTEPRSKSARESGELSTGAASLMLELVGERITGQRAEIPTTKEMQWGIDHEPRARNLFELRYGCAVETAGFFVWEENDMVGCSPDGLIGDECGLEIKCCWTSREHVRHILQGIPDQYLWQMRLSMLVTGRDSWEFCSYDPRIDDIDMALHRRTVTLDLDTRYRMIDAIENFTRHVDENVERVKACQMR